MIVPGLNLQCGKPNNVGDLEKQPFYKFLQSTYAIHPIALGALLYALGGFPYIVWGMVSANINLRGLINAAMLYVKPELTITIDNHTHGRGDHDE